MRDLHLPHFPEGFPPFAAGGGKAGCRLEVVGREGVPYALARLRRRQALAVGSIVCGMALVIGSFFIWDIQITGNDTDPKEDILQSLDQNGETEVGIGMSLEG